MVHKRICQCDVQFPDFVSEEAKDFIMAVSRHTDVADVALAA